MTLTVADLVTLLWECKRDLVWQSLNNPTQQRLDAFIAQLAPEPKPVVRVPVTWVEESRRNNKDGTIRWVYWKGSHGGGIYYDGNIPVPEYRSDGGRFATFEEAREASERVIAEREAEVPTPILCACGHVCGEDDEE